MNEVHLQHDLSLSSLTTLEVGGPVAAFAQVDHVEGLLPLLELADGKDWPVSILGGGSNLLASDRGFDGMLIQYTDTRVGADLQTGQVRVGAGHDWDELVAWTVGHELSGLECLSGIPGRAGAAPIQNIGAYGREVADVIEAVHAVDLRDGQVARFEAASCGFGYRESRFKREAAGRWCVTAIDLRLAPGDRPTPAYAELSRELVDHGDHPPLPAVRETVLAIRRRKSMVLDPNDPNRRSAGSFFTNPVVESAFADQIEATAQDPDPMPRWPVGAGRFKVPAAWLIERSGLEKGWGIGPAGLSDRHVLALVNRGGATAADLLAVAREVRDRVKERFGVRLIPEPVPIGFGAGEVDDLWPTRNSSPPMA